MEFLDTLNADQRRAATFGIGDEAAHAAGPLLIIAGAGSGKTTTLASRVANLIGEVGGNIVEVYHHRLFHDVPVKMADLHVVVETRDQDHVRELIEKLTEAGFNAKLLSNLSDDDGR